MQLPGLNFELGQDIDMLREAIRDFSDKEIAPLAAAADKDLVRVVQLACLMVRTLICV